jgi:hypothetical protein
MDTSGEPILRIFCTFCSSSSVNFFATSHVPYLPFRNLLDVNEKQVLGYDIMILSDLLHFSASHDALISSVQMLLAKLESARIYVGVSFTGVLNSTHANPYF